MASHRYFHGGPNALDLNAKADEAGYVAGDSERDKFTESLKKHHPLGRPNREKMTAVDGEPHVKVPALYCRLDFRGEPMAETRPLPIGALSFGLPGYGFFVVPVGGYVDLDQDIPEKVVKSVAPHLLTEAEYAHRKPVEEKPQAPVAQRK